MRELAERLIDIPGVVAVTLGGPHAGGPVQADSDCHFGLYYRDAIRADDVRALGFEGRVVEPREWGRLMNGGARLTVDDQRVDLLLGRHHSPRGEVAEPAVLRLGEARHRVGPTGAGNGITAVPWRRAEGTRYRLLETLRQYGRDRLRETGEAPAVRDAHLSWAVGLAEEAERHLDGLEQAAWLDALERELNNLRAALEWAITSRNAEAGLRLASITVGSLWTWRSHVPEGQRWLQRLLASPADLTASVRAKGLLAAGRVDFQAGQWPRGVNLCAQSRDLYRTVGDAAGEARALIWMAFNRWGIDDDDQIGEFLAAAIEAARRAERPLETAIALGLSGTWWSLRDVDRAHELVEEGGRLMERAGNPNWLAHSYEFRALVAYLQGDHRRARDLLTSALPLYLQIGNRVCSAHCLETTAALAAATGRPDGAAELLGAAERMRELLGTAAPPYERIVRERGVAAVQAALDENAAATARRHGRELGYEDAMARARSLAGRHAAPAVAKP